MHTYSRRERRRTSRRDGGQMEGVKMGIETEIATATHQTRTTEPKTIRNSRAAKKACCLVWCAAVWVVGDLVVL